MSTTVNHPGGSSQGYSYYSGQQQQQQQYPHHQQQQQQAHQHQQQSQHARKSSSRHGLFQGHGMPSLSTSHSPPGTFPPGTVITCGNHTCTVEKYLSEGGFAHVYLVKLAQVVDGTNLAVLKRVAVPDKEALSNMRTEVETMKRLKGHRHIVKYIDSHASHLQGSGYEVFLLMEFCSGGGLIDFMNTRLQNRLTEPEVLKIFTDIAEAVACMHYLEPPLLHRDLKIENILIQPNPRRYKLCDFGSSAPVTPAGKSVIECRALEEDIQKHTTMQYRSPEMIDVFKGLPIDEKSDIWALGVLLYKLCYYTTPFEGQGQLAILNASFKYPDYPKFSSALKNLIGSMLLEKPKERPNIYDVLKQACKLRGVDCPIKDIYTGRRPSPVKQLQESSRPIVTAAPQAKANKPQPQQQHQQQQTYPPSAAISQGYDIPEIPQMRRGRPPKSSNYSALEQAKAPTQALNSSSHSSHREPVRNDPFAALDKSSMPTDELSHKFPSVEQFSLAYDSGKKIDFSITSPTSAKLPDLPNFVDSDFNPSDYDNESNLHKPLSTISREGTASEMDRGIAVPMGRYHHSEGLPRSPSKSNASSLPSNAPVMMRMPSAEGSTRTPGGHVQAMALKAKSQEQIHRSLGPAPLSSASSLPSTASSLMSPPSDVGSHYSAHRPKTTHIESNLDFLRNLDSSGRPYGNLTGAGTLDSGSTGRSSPSQMEFIESNVDFLRALQHEADSARTPKSEKRHSSSKHSKRSSVPSASIANAKNLLAGRFGEAFKKFENNDGGGAVDNEEEAKERGSWEVTSHDIPHEMKREMEKRQLAEGDRRVELAAAEYKRNISNAQKRPSGRADLIQRQIVESLQDDNDDTIRPRSSVNRGKQMSSVSGPPSSKPYAMITSSSSSASSSYNNQRNQTAELARHMERLDVAPSPHFRPQSAQGLMLSHLPERGSSIRSSHIRPLPDRQHSSSVAPTMPTRQRPSVRERPGPPKPAPKPDKLRSMTPANDSIYMRSSLRSAHPHHRVALQTQQQQLRSVIPETDRLSTSPDKANYPLSSAVGSSEVDSIDMFKKRFPSL